MDTATGGERHSPLTTGARSTVERLMSEVVGRPVAIERVSGLGHEHAAVSVVGLDREIDGTATVVVKTLRADDTGHGGPAFLRREIAAHRTIGATAASLVAGLVAADLDAGVMVVEHIEGPTLEALLVGDDRDTAHDAVVAHAAALGRLRGLDAAALFEQELRALGAGDHDLPGPAATAHAEAGWIIGDAAHRLGLALPAFPHREFVSVKEAMTTAEHTLLHGDSNPGNVILRDATAVLVDLESCTVGHAGRDLVELLVPYPFYSAHPGSLPADTIAAAIDAYTAAAGPGSAADAVVAPALVDALIRRLERLAKIGDDRARPDVRWRRRAQMVAQLDAILGLRGTLAGQYPAMVEWMAAVRAALVERWPESLDPPVPTFPAFTGPPRPAP